MSVQTEDSWAGMRFEIRDGQEQDSVRIAVHETRKDNDFDQAMIEDDDDYTSNEEAIVGDPDFDNESGNEVLSYFYYP